MNFYEVLDHVVALLRQRGRLTYRALKYQFQLDDDGLEALKEELVQAQRIAIDEGGKVLVWVGDASVASSQFPVASPQPPAPSTQHLNARHQTLDASGERRQLTVEFIDLVGSTTLSQQLDPEDYHARVVAYQTACHQVIARYEGHIAQYLGDGVLVYFGYPTAHEEDAARAVRAGLEIVAAVSQLVYTPPLQVRIGVHTGPVVVGEIGEGEKREMLALGETPNIAARVQGQAEPDTVVISGATYRLVQGLFECQDRGPQELKGISTPLPLYRVIGESAAQSRFEVAVRTGLTPLVGREPELGLLRAHWERAKTGKGQVVLLNGEPGIGKSRLVQTLKEQVTSEGATRIEFRCSPYHQNSALYPIIDHLQRLLQFAREDSPATKLEKLQHMLSYYRFPQADTVPLLAALLSLPHPADSPPLTGSPQKQKEKLQAALVAWLVEKAEKAAVYCAWEDLHWADPSTLEVLTLFLDQAPTTQLLVLLTFRPEFMPPWGNRSHLNQMTLSRLGRSQVEAMVERVTGGKTLPPEVMQQIVAKTDGVPLFVEELTKTVIESIESIESIGSVGAHGRAPLRFAIPATLQDALMARLDRLGPAKEIAQLGATIGREFSYEIIHVVSPLDEETLQQGLKQLVQAELVYQRWLVPQAHYLFKHALVQDTAYQSLLKSARQQYHQQIGRVLEERSPEIKDTQPELLAHHYTEASLIEQAIPYWQQAGERALKRSANIEALGHLTKGMELLKTLPDTRERTQHELTLQLALGEPLMAIKGEGAPELESVYTRALELCQQVGETPQLFPTMAGLYLVHTVRGELRSARELAEQLLRLAQNAQDPALLLSAHLYLGISVYFMGEFASAHAYLEQAFALYDPQQYRSQAFRAGLDPGVWCLCYKSWVLWCLGYPDQALRKSQDALTLAQEMSRPYSVAVALVFAAQLHLFRREAKLTQERAEAVIALSTEQGFPMWALMGTDLRNLALTMQGQIEEAFAQMRQSRTARVTTGAKQGASWGFATLAEAYEKKGQPEQGLGMLAKALVAVDKDEERYYEAEVYRLKGTLTLQKGARDWGLGTGPSSQAPSLKPQAPNGVEREAEECFHKAIEIARQQSAKSLELRAVMSLSRLWQQQGKKDEARQMLAEIYNWFTEGFDTKDLQEAKALLDSLGSSVKKSGKWKVESSQHPAPNT